MKNRLFRLFSVGGLLLVFAGSGLAEEADRPAGKDREGVSDRREQFRNASPEERRRMMMEKRRDREESGNRDAQGPKQREGRSGTEGRQNRGPDMQNRLMYHIVSNPERAAKMGIPEEQAAAIKQKLEENEQQMRQVQEEMRALARRQAEMMTGDNINEEELMNVVEEVGARNTALAKLRIKQLMIVKNGLNEEQLGKLRKMFQDKRRRMMEQNRDGGPGMKERPTDRPKKMPERDAKRDRNLNAD